LIGQTNFFDGVARSVGVSLRQTQTSVRPPTDSATVNLTGFTSYDYGIGAKWLELLKEIAPSLTRVVGCGWTTGPADLR
jgi:hypothetical protein